MYSITKQGPNEQNRKQREQHSEATRGGGAELKFILLVESSPEIQLL